MRFVLSAVSTDGCNDGDQDPLVKTYVYTSIGCSSLLIFMYLYTFYRAKQGERYRFILMSVKAMIASNIGTIMIVVADLELLSSGNASVGICWMLGLGYLLQNSCFNIVIYMLA